MLRASEQPFVYNFFFAVSQLMPRVARREQSDGVSTVRQQVLGLLPELSAHINVCLRQLAGQRRLLQEFSFLSQAGMSRHIISNSIRLAIRGADKSASHPTLEEDRGMSGFGTVLIGPSGGKKKKIIRISSEIVKLSVENVKLFFSMDIRQPSCGKHRSHRFTVSAGRGLVFLGKRTSG